MPGLRYATLLGCLIAVACTGVRENPPTLLSIEQLQDPETCRECHSTHYDEWSGSMHAYASIDPVFLAMNQKGQRETGGALGDFCVQCHAPMAVRLGLTRDGLNLPELPRAVQGVTCYFCHSVESVEGTHNNPLLLTEDGMMRGGYRDPHPNSAHRSGYSALLDRDELASATLCGSCHDLVNRGGVHLQRTFLEWKTSLFAHEGDVEQKSCGDCHMKARAGQVSDTAEAPVRRIHSHMMVGSGSALTPFPQKDEQAARIQRELNSTVSAQLCVRSSEGQAEIEVILENSGAGHHWPTGPTFDRRAWVEVVALDDANEVLFESGRLNDGQALSTLEDTQLWRLGSQGFNERGEPVHYPWEITRLESEILPVPTEKSSERPGFIDVHRRRTYRYDGPSPTAVTVRVRMRPIGLDLLDDLIESGDLEPAYRELIKTYDLGFTRLEWSRDDAAECIPQNHMERFGIEAQAQ